MTLPLSDIRVIAVEQFGAGPWATLQLADLGAEVIKIEDPAAGGDVGRYVPPYQSGEDSLFFESFNRGKKSISLDLRHPASRAVLEDLVRASDALYCNLRGDGPEKLRLRFADLREANPRLVCCSLSAFGNSGPRAEEGGYDYVVQALGGWMSLTGGPDEPPTKSGLSLVDLSAGYVSAIALLAGIWRARRDGVGCDCDISLFETALSELAYVGTWVASRGYQPVRLAESAHPSMVPFQTFPTADGWIVVAAPKQHLWEALCTAIERPELADEPRFIDFAARNDNRDALASILRDVFRTRETTEWVRRLQNARVPAGPVNNVAEALRDPQAEAREAIVEYEHPSLGTVKQVASPFHVDDWRPEARRAPSNGEQTAEILQGLCGYDAERMRALAVDGVFGSSFPGEAVDSGLELVDR
jgi:crotonobetainyl-CoA:carnitine CoA-transferase CaiB-like acyl-CoA transferase